MSQLLSLGAVNKVTGEYVYPKIANKKDEYICPECNKDLILCQGEIRAHHFRHKVDSVNPCYHYSNPTEAQIHKDAKILLKTLLERKISIIFIRNCCCCKKNEEFEIPEISETSVIKLEYRFEYNGVKIADVAYIDDGNIVCIFEICNTHKTCSENRPNDIEWFEINAETLIKIANDNSLTKLQIPCIRCEKCESCIDKENANLKHYNIEKYVRLKLGQKYPIPEYEYDDSWLGNKIKHLRFNFDARDDITNNKNIIELFNEDFIDKKIVIHFWKGCVTAYVISKLSYNKYDYWGEGWQYGNMRFPCEKTIDMCGKSTIQIIIELIKYCENANFIKKEYFIKKENKNTKDIIRKLDRENFIYLNIDFSKKDIIKNLGGKWNKEYKLWYISYDKYKKHENQLNMYRIFWKCKECEEMRKQYGEEETCVKCFKENVHWIDND
jgi:hypothetical protein